jgi:hypothetical protein
MRYDDWQARFWLWMQHQRTQRFVWGERDCILFAASGGDAVSDSRYVERAKAAFGWTNAREAAALLADTSLQALIERVLGPMQKASSLGMADFVLVFDDEGRESLAIHDGSIIIGPDEYGVKRIPFRCVKGGWRVT